MQQYDERSTLTLLQHWRINCFRSQIANYDAAGYYSKMHYWLGVPTVILSAVVGTSVFATLGTEVKSIIQIAVGSISVLAATLAALQTFMNWDERATNCRTAAAEYGAVKRKIDQTLAAIPIGECVNDETINEIRKQMDELSQKSYGVPDFIWARARKKVPTVHDD